NRRPLALGITAAFFSCIVLLAVLAIYWYTVLSIRGPAAPTPNATSVAAPSPTASASGTPGAQGTSGGSQSATPAAIQTPDSADVDSLNALLKTAINERDLITLTHRLRKVTQPIPAVVNATSPSFKTGDQRLLWVADQPNKKNFTTTA